MHPGNIKRHSGAFRGIRPDGRRAGDRAAGEPRRPMRGDRHARHGPAREWSRIVRASLIRTRDGSARLTDPRA
ncbi:hypothetical protein GCM10027161_06960 [Microbispora hainanensis]